VKAGVESGAIYADHIFIQIAYTSECTISLSNFQNFLCLRQQGGIDPLTKILRTPLNELGQDGAGHYVSK